MTAIQITLRQVRKWLHLRRQLSPNAKSRLPNNYFNMSISYHTDSAIYLPYDQLSEITSQTPRDQIWSDREIQMQINKKQQLALQIVSHCNAPSGRDLITEQLQNLMELDVFGNCNSKSCDDACYQRELESHFFYLAFENTVCPQYVTEKFWNALRSLVVPVVLNRSVLNGTGIPDNVYIAADDFDSVQALADFLTALLVISIGPKSTVGNGTTQNHRHFANCAK
uniref:Fucosyltransferase n=1 Tax=Globodera rostochiensis TaxID=31243 RepID=A0A914HGN4_GLORO